MAKYCKPFIYFNLINRLLLINAGCFVRTVKNKNLETGNKQTDLINPCNTIPASQQQGGVCTCMQGRRPAGKKADTLLILNSRTYLETIKK